MARKTKAGQIRATVLAQPHRADPVVPETAHCAFWLSPEQLDTTHARHVAMGRTLTGTTPCFCGNHDRRMYG